MRVIICDYAGHPFQVELSRCLARRGHSVLHLYFADLQAPKGGLTVQPDDPPTFAVEGLRTGTPFSKSRYLQRRFLEAKVGDLVAQRVASFEPDVFAGCNMPLDAQKKAWRACMAEGTAFVFWLQDVISIATNHFLSEKLGLLGHAIGWHYMRLEAAILNASDAIVAISHKFLQPLEQWGVDRRKVRVVPNWAPLSHIRPMAKENGWADRHGLQDKLVALYSGTLGMKHDPALLLNLARLGDGRGMHVTVISEGPAAEWLKARSDELSLRNLVVLPYQPMEIYSEALGTSDILLAMIGREAAGFSVPSKILSYLAAGRPVVASITVGNDAATTIAEAQAGIVVEPDDAAGFEAAVMRLATDPGLRDFLGQNARRYAESHFDVEAKAIKFEETFAAAMRSAAQRSRGGTRARILPAGLSPPRGAAFLRRTE